MRQLNSMIYYSIILLFLGVSGCSSVPSRDASIVPPGIQLEFKQINTNVDVKFSTLHDEIKQQKNYFDLELDYIKKEIQLNNNNIMDCCHDRFDINNIDVQIQQQYDIHIKPILIKIPALEKQLDTFIVETDKKLSLQEKDIQHVRQLTEWNKASMSQQLSFFSIIMGSILGVISIVVAIAIFILNRDRKIAQKEQEKQREQERKEHKDEIKRITEKHALILHQLGYYEQLQLILTKSKPSAEEIFPLLTVLLAKPSIMFAPLFKKLIDLNINPEITAKAKEGLSKLNML